MGSRGLAQHKVADGLARAFPSGGSAYPDRQLKTPQTTFNTTASLATRNRAMALLMGMVGALAVARTPEKADPKLSGDVHAWADPDGLDALDPHGPSHHRSTIEPERNLAVPFFQPSPRLWRDQPGVIRVKSAMAHQVLMDHLMCPEYALRSHATNKRENARKIGENTIDHQAKNLMVGYSGSDRSQRPRKRPELNWRKFGCGDRI